MQQIKNMNYPELILLCSFIPIFTYINRMDNHNTIENFYMFLHTLKKYIDKENQNPNNQDKQKLIKSFNDFLNSCE